MEKTFSILAEHFRPMVFSYLRMLTAGDTEAAEDLTQETFLAAYESIDRFDESNDFAPWLRGIARNKFLNHRRTLARKKLVVDSRVVAGMEDIYSCFDDGSNDLENWRERVALLKVCIAQLSDRLREAIEHTYAQGKRLANVAKDVGSTPQAVGQRLSRARRLIRDCVTRRTEN